jgi:glycosyltransferase involved in cell wall biosynthesis
MKVLMVARTSIKYSSGYWSRVKEEAKMICRENIKLTLLVFYPVEEITSSQLYNEKEILVKDGVKVIFLPSLPSSRLVLWEKIRILVMLLLLDIVAAIAKPDIIHAQSVEAGYLTYMLKAKRKFKFILDAHGAAAKEFKESGEMSTRTALVRSWEKLSLKEADGLICVSKALLVFLSSEYKTKAKTKIVPCSIDETTIVNKKINKKSALSLVYAGGVQKYQLVGKVGELWQSLVENGLSLSLLVITKEKLAASRLLGSKRGLKVISSHQKNVIKLLRTADIGVLLREEIWTNKVASPTKAAEYWAAGLPIITTAAVGQVRDKIKNNSDLGLIINLDNLSNKKTINSLLKFINEVSNNRARMSDSCIQTARKFYSWQRNIKEIIQLYEEI